MKATKNKRIGLSEKKSNSKIQDFFKSTEKESTQHECSDIKSMYRQALKNRVKSLDEDSTDLTNTTRPESGKGTAGDAENDEAVTASVPSTSAKKSIKSKPTIEIAMNGCKDCITWHQKYDELTKRYLKLSVINSDLLMKNSDLVKCVTENVTEKSDEHGMAESLPVSNGHGMAGPLPADAAVFTDTEIIHLKSIPLVKKKDSSFLLQCVNYAYKDPAVLCTRTLFGTVDRVEVRDGVETVVRPAKDPLTPEKVKAIKQLFIKRVNDSKCNAVELGERIATTNIHQLIAGAIKNVSLKEKPKEKKLTPNADLDL